MSAETQSTWGRTRRAGEPPFDDNQIREALFRRVERYLRESIAHLDQRGLLDALEAPTPGDTVARVISAAPIAALEQDPWAEALLRGAAMKQEAIQLAGGLLSSGEVAALLGVSVTAIKQRQRRAKVLAVPLPNGEWGYPARQFAADGRVCDGVADVVSAFPEGTSGWEMLSLFVNPVPGDQEGTAFDALSDPEAVAKLVELAATHGEQAAT